MSSDTFAKNIIEEIKKQTTIHTLKNGLRVIIRQNNHAPVVAVSILYHVGANREERGKTGLAHLFEHMMFQKSGHVKDNEFFRIVQSNGGVLNGGTWQDGTIYYEVVPKNVLESVLWLESDRMGYLLEAIDQKSLINQIGVVMNEKRQRGDNQAYGHLGDMIDKTLYQENHPYYTSIIGEMKDLAEFSVLDMQDFFTQWYGPQNAALVISGDVDTDHCIQLVEKYFNDIPHGSQTKKLLPMVPYLSETKKIHYFDQFAEVPHLALVFPTINDSHDDYEALNMLVDVIGNTKTSLLYTSLIEAKKIATAIDVSHHTGEIASIAQFDIRSNDAVSNEQVYEETIRTLNHFKITDSTTRDIAKLKTRFKTSLFNSLESNLEVAKLLSLNTIFRDSPFYFEKEIEKLLSITAENISFVWEKYIFKKPHVVAEVLPIKNGKKTPITNSNEFYIDARAYEIKISSEDTHSTVSPNFSSFDRSNPPYIPVVQQFHLPKISTIVQSSVRCTYVDVPNTSFVKIVFTIPLGYLRENKTNFGINKIISQLIQDGTKNRTGGEFQEALMLLGAEVFVDVYDDSLAITLSVLEENYLEAYRLVEEMILKPSFNSASFEKFKVHNLKEIEAFFGDNDSIADFIFNQIVYGYDHPAAQLIFGTKSILETMTLDQVIAYYSEGLVNNNELYVTVAGRDALKITTDLFITKFTKKESLPIVSKTFQSIKNNILYIIDVPGSQQSEIRIGSPAPTRNHEDYLPLIIGNYNLGEEPLTSKLSLVIREEKGYTYGIMSSIFSGRRNGVWEVSTAVDTSTTGDTLRLTREIISAHVDNYNEDDLVTTRKSKLNAYSRKYETINQLFSNASTIANNRLPDDYLEKEMEYLKSCSSEEIKNILQKYIDPNKCFYIVVGDKKEILKTLNTSMFDDIVYLDTHGNHL